MAVQTKLYNLFSNINTYRTVLANRTTIINFTQPIAGLRLATREKIKTLPPKPKKPATAFIRFSMQRRSELQKEHPSASVVDISKMLGAEWKSVHTSVKERFENEYRQEMKGFLERNVQYLAKLTDEQKKFLDDVKNERKEEKDKRYIHKLHKETNKPKRPLTAYMLFMQSKTGSKGGLRAALADHKGEWLKLTAPEKKSFVQTAEDEKKRYELEMDVWESKMIKTGNTELVRKSTLETIKPKRPIASKKTDNK